MKCKATFPWASEPCQNDSDGHTIGCQSDCCWECFDELREIERESRGRDSDDMYF